MRETATRGWIVATCAAVLLGSMTARHLSAQTTREDFTTFAQNAGKLDSLRKGVANMMALDQKAGTDLPLAMLSPMGWKYQAYIHGTPESVDKMMDMWTADEKAVWDTCQHSTWYFLAWHRMELYFFERIIRVMAGDNTLSVPYWNFGVPAMVATPPVGARLPPEFRVVPTDKAPNSLYWPQRNANVNKPPATPDTAMPLSGTDTTTLAAFMKMAFFTNVKANGIMSFGGGASVATAHFDMGMGTGQLENIPHNSVHLAVGNGTESSMSNPAGAGLDPIFWPIHINIDRAWACWQQTHGDQVPPADSAWQTTMFTFFDAGGTAANPMPVMMKLSGKQIIDTAKQLNYMYDNCNGLQGYKKPAPKIRPNLTSRVEGDGQEAGASHALSATVPFHDILGNKPAVVRIPIPQEMQARLAELARGGTLPEGAVTLSVGGLAIDNISAGPAYSLFLGLREGGFPDETGSNYVSQLNFFGIGHHRYDDEHQDYSMAFDLTNVVEGLMGRGEWRQDEVVVTFANTAALYTDRVKAPPAQPEDRARFTSLRLTVQ